MRLPTFKPNDIDYARLMREWELLDDRNKVLERENAALNHKLDEILTNKNYEGGVQFWINKHDEVLLREASLLAENAALKIEVNRLRVALQDIAEASTGQLTLPMWIRGKVAKTLGKEAQP